MNRTLNLFLRAKSWQLCIISAVLFAFELWVLKLHSSATLDVHRLSLLQNVSSLLDLVFVFVWAWSAGTFVNSVLEPSLQFEKPFFYFSLIYPFLYLALRPELRVLDHRVPIWLRIILGGLSVICELYVVSSVARSLVSLETGKLATFSAYAAEFFAIWFFPVGVWFVQPRINRLYGKMVGVKPEAPLTSVAR